MTSYSAAWGPAERMPWPTFSNTIPYGFNQYVASAGGTSNFSTPTTNLVLPISGFDGATYAYYSEAPGSVLPAQAENLNIAGPVLKVGSSPSPGTYYFSTLATFSTPAVALVNTTSQLLPLGVWASAVSSSRYFDPIAPGFGR